MTNDERSELHAAFRELYLGRTGQPAPLPPLKRPAELDDPATDPVLRQQVHSSYAAAITDRPNNTWTAEQRAVVHAETLRVLREMGQ
jgi:hypothetical protein